MAYPHLERGVRVIDRFAELSGVAIAWSSKKNARRAGARGR